MEKLTKQEEQAMLAIWRAGSGVIKDFLDLMEEPQPHYNTLVSTIKNLEKKGMLKAGNWETCTCIRLLWKRLNTKNSFDCCSKKSFR